MEATHSEKNRIIKEYFEVLLFRDILERNKFEGIPLARQIFVMLIRLYANRFSLNQSHKKLKELGFKLDKSILSSFIRWCEDAYILFPVKLFSASEHKSRLHPLKLYLSDLALAQACEVLENQNLGRRFENICFIHIRSSNSVPAIHYYLTKSGKEVDFLLTHSHGKKELIQCCWSLSEEAFDRETSALFEAMNELDLKESTIITFNEEQKIKKGGKTINVIDFHSYFK